MKKLFALFIVAGMEHLLLAVPAQKKKLLKKQNKILFQWLTA